MGIHVQLFIWPILHTLIGASNAILAYLIDIIEAEIQQLPAKEINLKRILRKDMELIVVAHEARNVWDSSNG